jgi:hypothetical protein
MQRFWLIFDIGLSTSFEELYSWLDDQKAIECGDNAATFVTPKSYESVEKEVRKACRNGGGSRVYLIGPQKAASAAPVPTTPGSAPSGPRLIGKFIVGRRKAPPWSGFGSASSPDEKDEG